MLEYLYVDFIIAEAFTIVNTLLMQSQTQWAGHIAHMPYHRLHKIMFYGGMWSGKRSQLGQKKRSKDTLKTSLKSFGIVPDTWETSALNELLGGQLSHNMQRHTRNHDH